MTLVRLRKLWLIGSVVAALAQPLSAQTISRLPSPAASNESPHMSRSPAYAVQPVSAHSPAAGPERLPETPASPEAILAPRPSASGPSADPPADFGGDTSVIDLPTALLLADRVNPEIGISRQAIQQSLALLQGARVLLLPSLTAGTNYHLHNGNLQRPDGTILELSQQSLYYGGGAQAIGTQTVTYPAIRIFAHLGDAVFEPLAARQQTVVRRFDADASFNSVLLSVSTRYLGLMAAEARLEVLHESRADAGEVVRITVNFARVGQGRQADADRVKTEAILIDSQIQRAQEQVAVAAAELSQLLNLDPSTRLKTVGGPIPLLQLVDPSYRLNQLLDIALRQRPEVAARNAEIAETETRYRQERTRPLLPTISVGFSAGAFGGGSNFTNPTFGLFGGRTDFDAIAFWTVQNLGVGNGARWRGRQAQTGEAAAARVRAVNLVRREVAEAYAQVSAGRQEVNVQEKRLAAAEAGFREELNRIRGGEGLPIELLDNLTRLVAARQALVAAVAAYDQAQFRLFVALGQAPTLALPNTQGLRAADGQ